MSFKAGDKVRFVDFSGLGALTYDLRGREFTVGSYNGEFVYLKDDGLAAGGWFPSRFEKVSSPIIAEWWELWHCKPGEPRVRVRTSGGVPVDISHPAPTPESFLTKESALAVMRAPGRSKYLKLVHVVRRKR